MCRIILFSGITDSTREIASRLAKKVTPEMTAQNRDGFGFAAMDLRGGLSTGRWLSPKAAWAENPERSPELREAVRNFGDMLCAEESAFSGRGLAALENFSTLVLHARAATSEKTLSGVHPHISLDGKTALVHNGVVGTENLRLLRSRCDSEGILNEYLMLQIKKHPERIDDLIAKLQGSYACVVLSAGEGVDIFKNSATSLNAVFVPALKNFVLATEPGNILKAAKCLRLAAGPVYPLAENRLLRLGLDGKTLFSRRIATRKLDDTSLLGTGLNSDRYLNWRDRLEWKGDA